MTENLRAEMRAQGLDCDKQILTGKITRFKTSRDSGQDESGWVIYYSDPVGVAIFGDWHESGKSYKWVDSKAKQLSERERREANKKLREAQEKAAEEAVRIRLEAKKRAQEIFSSLEPEIEQISDYYVRKKVIPRGSKKSKGISVIPVYIDDEISSLQFISETGQKKFLRGGAVRGGYFRIDGSESDIIFIAEGYATGLSVHAATNRTVYCAFNAGNLEAVGEYVRRQHPSDKIVFCADDDTKPGKSENPGIEAAKLAAKRISAEYIAPDFSSLIGVPSRLTDFNDLHVFGGLDAVRGQLLSRFKPFREISVSEPESDSVAVRGDSVFTDFTPTSLKPSIVAQSLQKSANGRIIYDELKHRFYVFNRVWRERSEEDLLRGVQTLFDARLYEGYSPTALKSVMELFKLYVGHGEENRLEWDDGKFLPFENGILRLSDLKFMEFSPDFKVNWMLPYSYDPQATCPTFDLLMSRLSAGSEETKKIILCFLAAIIRQKYQIQKYLEITGFAGSGKSSLIKVAENLVGERNCVVSNMRTLGASRFETASFYGKRLAIFPDEQSKVRDGTDVFKSIIGGDPLRYELKNKAMGDNFIFKGLAIVSANSPMIFDDYSAAIPRRRIPIHIDYVIRAEDRDPEFFSKLKNEMPGIVNQVLAISDEEIYKTLSTACKASETASVRSLIETNPIAAWVDERIVLDPNAWAYMGSLIEDRDGIQGVDSLLFANYVQYVRSHFSGDAVSVEKLTRTIKEIFLSNKIKSVSTHRTNRGNRWDGIRLRTVHDIECLTPLTKATIDV